MAYSNRPSATASEESRPGIPAGYLPGQDPYATYADFQEIKRIGELRRLIKEKGAGKMPAPFLCSAQAYPQD